MAYNKEVHNSLEQQVNNSVEDLEKKIDNLQKTVNELLKGKGAQLSGVSAKTVQNLELLRADTLQSIHANGQAIADADSILVYDSSEGFIRRTTLSNFYKRYLNAQIPRAMGTHGHVQLKGPGGGGEFTTSPHLIFKQADQILEIEGTVKARHLDIGNTVTANISTVTENVYTLTSYDYTLLADTAHNHVVINLPDPGTCHGRILNFKKIANENTMVLLCTDNLVDGSDSTILSKKSSC